MDVFPQFLNPLIPQLIDYELFGRMRQNNRKSFSERLYEDSYTPSLGTFL